MPLFHVNKNAPAGGEHEVHENGCAHQPLPENRLSLGTHATCKGAVQEAKKTYPNSDGCAYCCPACHTR
jgi:hypothetical protein